MTLPATSLKDSWTIGDALSRSGTGYLCLQRIAPWGWQSDVVRGASSTRVVATAAHQPVQRQLFKEQSCSDGHTRALVVALNMGQPLGSPQVRHYRSEQTELDLTVTAYHWAQCVMR